MKHKPVAVIQHIATGGVGQFGEYARTMGIPIEVFAAYADDDLPASMHAYSGLCVLGGPMSANDDIPYLRQTESLIRDSIADDIPVIGHCLGGQLMARALGARVQRSAHPEIGWVPTHTTAEPAAGEWFGQKEFPIFHWHSESFEIPPGAQHLARSEWCETQAYALGGRHFGMQFHCEITPEIIDAWLAAPSCQRAIAELSPDWPGVQTEQQMRSATERHIASSNRTATAIYTRWARNLKV